MPATTNTPASDAATAYEAIVIGGSAGALDALSVVLPTLPASLRASVLVVLHLPRDRRSLLGQLFGPRCALPVREVQDQQWLEPGCLYFAPADYHLLVDSGPRLALSLDAPWHFSRPSIDVLFESAADCYGERLLAVLLSGANEDGAQGMASVHAAGGLAVVQSPDSAAMQTMPRAALARVPQAQVQAPQGIAALIASLHGQGRL
ncbi:chemotaxis protein CheB [Delftia acidovorans]|uniref:chemotaxis protein CheB n=1 Tax=Delftia acidovorans TaxID=80866 RepID=UPI002FDC7C6C